MRIIKEGSPRISKEVFFKCDGCSCKFALMSNDSKIGIVPDWESGGFSHYDAKCPSCKNECVSPDFRKRAIYIGFGSTLLFALFLICLTYIRFKDS